MLNYFTLTDTIYVYMYFKYTGTYVCVWFHSFCYQSNYVCLLCMIFISLTKSAFVFFSSFSANKSLF